MTSHSSASLWCLCPESPACSARSSSSATPYRSTKSPKDRTPRHCLQNPKCRMNWWPDFVYNYTFTHAQHRHMTWCIIGSLFVVIIYNVEKERQEQRTAHRAADPQRTIAVKTGNRQDTETARHHPQNRRNPLQKRPANGTPSRPRR